MKVIITTALLIVSMCAIAAAQPDNGIYLRAQGEAGLGVISHDGRRLFLGAKQTLKIEQSFLSAQNMENSKFYLWVTIPFDDKIGPTTYILIFAGNAYQQTGSGAATNKRLRCISAFQAKKMPSRCRVI